MVEIQRHVRTLALLLAGTWFCLAGSLPAAPTPHNTVDDTTHATVLRGAEKFIAAMGAADAEAFGALFAPDGVLLGSQGRVTRGPEAIAAHMAMVYEQVGPIEVTISTADMWRVDERTVYKTGGYVFQYGPDDDRTELTGRYVTVWQLQPDGEWRILVDLDVPLGDTDESSSDD